MSYKGDDKHQGGDIMEMVSFMVENGERKKVKVFAYYFTVEETGVYYWDGTGNVAVERWRVQLFCW